MKLSEMNEEQRAGHHKLIAEQIFDITQRSLDACDGYQDYIDYMGFVMDEVSHVFMEGIKAKDGEQKKFSINSGRYNFAITEHAKTEKQEEAEDGKQ